MRGILWSFALTCVITLMGLATQPSVASMSGSSVVYAAAVSTGMDAQQAPIDVDINVKRDSGHVAWYRSPLWLAIAIVAGVVLLLLLMLAFRGTGTTVVR